MKTELIASWKLVTVDCRDMYIVNTVSGNVIWVTKSQFDTNAEQITYKVMKAGDEYTDKSGKIKQLKNDRNEFLGCGKQIVKKCSSVELLDHLTNKGVTPTFSFS